MIDRDLMCLHEYMRRRASGKMYQVFRINKDELNMLLCLCACCAFNESPVVGKRVLFDSMTGNTKSFKKYEGYLKGLIAGKFVGCFEYIPRPGSLSLGVSVLGEKVIDAFQVELNALIERYRIDKPQRVFHLSVIRPTRYIEYAA